MVSKKKRRKQLAHAASERQALRRADREATAHRRQRIALVVVVVLLAAGLIYWIATHPGSSAPSGAEGIGGTAAHYAGSLYHHNHLRGLST